MQKMHSGYSMHEQGVKFVLAALYKGLTVRGWEVRFCDEQMDSHEWNRFASPTGAQHV